MSIIPTAESGETGGVFDTIGGLPVHPLIDHVVAVLLPLSALALIVIVVVPRWRTMFRWLVLAGLGVSTIAAFVAKESGEALAERVGLPAEHAELGNVLPAVALMLLVVASAWLWLCRKDEADSGSSSRLGSGLSLVTAMASMVLAVVAVGMTVLVGHSGAQAVWASRVAPVESSSVASTAVGTASPGTGESATSYTLADVAAHGSGADCWSAIDGTVYDLTTWIGQHPGGPAVIQALCGTDGSAAFNGQHGGQGEPKQALSGLALGPVR